METVRKAKVIRNTEKGWHMDEDSFYLSNPDSNPEHYYITFLGINCTTEEFLEWFLVSDKSYGIAPTGNKNTVVDVGSHCLELSVGSIVTVTYSEFFDSFLNNLANWALAQTFKDSLKAYSKLGIERK